MDNTVGGDNIANDDFGIVNPKLAILLGDPDVVSKECRIALAILDDSRVRDCASNRVILEGLGELLSSEIGEIYASSLERVVGGSEDGELRSRVNEGGNICLGDSGDQDVKLGGDSGLGRCLGEVEDTRGGSISEF